MDEVKRALVCSVVDDNVKAILIKGPAGTAKSTIARSFVNVLPGVGVVNVPHNVTDEQLFGGMDLEHAIMHGRASMEDGLMKKANGNILYLDNVNLFDRRVLGSIMDCVEAGRVKIERDGMSAEYGVRTRVIATMDPSEGLLPEHILDRFDVCVQTYTSQGSQERCNVISLNLDLDRDLDVTFSRFEKGDEAVTQSISVARSRLRGVTVVQSDILKISQICIDLGIEGHRGDVSIAKVARAIAAIDGNESISNEDIKDAAIMCLLHRRTNPLMEGFECNEADTSELDMGPDEEEPVRRRARPSDVQQDQTFEEDVEMGHSKGPGTGEMGTVLEISNAVKGRLDEIDEVESISLRKLIGSSKRGSIATGRRAGRYRGHRLPKGRSLDPAMDATIRVATPYQAIREKKGLSIAIEAQDIRDKIRVKRDSCSFLFAVDVSGSSVNGGMMRNIKNGVRAMLMDGYVHRDKVALLTFGSKSVVLSVPFTRSVESIYEMLDSTPAGGGTPLGTALLKIREYLMNHVRKNPDERCYVILITDGYATNPVVGGSTALIELKRIAAIMEIPNTEWAVVDSSMMQGKGIPALRLATMLGAKYIRLEDLEPI